jgi:hypothetical protein
MSEDWKNYKSGAAIKADGGQDLTNPGLPVLNDQDEYVFRLETVILKRQVEGFKAGEKVDKFYTTWKEEKTGNVLMISFRVDKLRFNPDNPKFQTPVLTFFSKIGIPIREGEEPVWQTLFIEGMRIRGRVQPVTKDGKATGGYRMEIPTLRKYQV